MPSKRNIGSEPVVSGGAVPTRGTNRVTRKHKTAPAAETPETVIKTSAAEPSTLSSAESPARTPAFEEIARLAYSYWEARGYLGGSPEEDWLRAETELRSAQLASAAN
jgi:hypothetical protein